MARVKTKRNLLPAMSQTGGGGDNQPSGTGQQAPSISQAEYEEMLLAFNDGDVDYNTIDHSTDDNPAVVKKKKSIKSNSSVHLVGPMEVDGSVKSMGSIGFLGDFAVRDKIEAYGNIDISGNVTCNDKVKSFGNIDIVGYVYCASRIKIFGKLTVNGHLEVADNIEVWGAVVIQGYMKCKSLTAYASVTTVGDDSYYEVEDSETVWGAKLVRRTEDDA
ncbi:hypothetical protein SPI_06617 [Niveomyces insectorum RCEF 264]|uniref:Polymer-forming cytoskeletal protein n=1 Tax=Niveomyces insectorum RCEF 264 TaxID=1081102 RepID=A0A167RFL5_9HYPO|nr:hypothetical protein SPI_06617 [Niveomyces insectorum RCEF 264]